MTPRSWLFVPGDSSRKLEKAASAGADALIIDLEDSVADSGKEEARRATAAYLASSGRAASMWVRVNPLSSSCVADVHAVACPALAGVVLPKCEGGADLARLGDILLAVEKERGLDPGHIRVLPIVTETAAAIFLMNSFAPAPPRMAGMTWGAEDLSSAVGASSPRDDAGELTMPYQMARSFCLFAAAAANVAAIETVYPNFRDLAGLANYAARGRRDGFRGMMAIHPSQVPIINQAFAPSDEEVRRASEIIALFANQPGAGTLALRGEMIDRPHLRQAQNVLARAQQGEPDGSAKTPRPKSRL
ncbi:HpcH/HpaI aldolase/citrate lyase family protein [Methylocella silvestris]|uniref:CoA ester lyase n=1 Tax=Methylocella silvestris TaxID=199596 RepID=A0A2J7TFY2_METSI|nr:CoA ester lyase [Methylocella silvestris]PNG25677.1 CoA ester lyase [Methylocella silvestris]